MKQISFLHGIILAVILSTLGASLFFSFIQFDNFYWSYKLIITLLSFAYILYLLFNTKEKIGRITLVLVWCTLAVLLYFSEFSLLSHTFIHIVLIWFTRCLYYHSGLLGSSLDFCLQLLSFSMALWALENTGSIWLSFWSFFLGQALFIFIPQSMIGNQQQDTAHSLFDKAYDNRSFQRAYQYAETALRRISNAN